MKRARACVGVVTICALLLAGCTSGTTTAASPSATPSASPSPSSPSPTPTATSTEEPNPPVKEARLEGTLIGQGFVTQLKFEPKCKKGPCDVVTEAVVQLDKGDTQKAEGDLELKGQTYKGTLPIETTCDFQGGPTFHPPGRPGARSHGQAGGLRPRCVASLRGEAQGEGPRRTVRLDLVDHVLHHDLHLRWVLVRGFVPGGQQVESGRSRCPPQGGCHARVTRGRIVRDVSSAARPSSRRESKPLRSASWNRRFFAGQSKRR